MIIILKMLIAFLKEFLKIKNDEKFINPLSV